MAKVSLKGLTKRFGDQIAVNNVSLDIEDKELLVLLGPSGCGKTTTLRCIAGLESPDDGEMYIRGTLVNELSPKDRNVAMVFQSYALYPHMSVSDNIAFPLKMQKVPKNERDTKVRRTAKLLRISHLLDRKPKQLSGGEAQRVALGRAIVRDPSVFLMDEPLSNLDATLRVYMRAELKRLQKDLGVTTVYVTHDQVEAMSMADRIAVMNLGLLQQVDNSHEIFYSPKNRFVAGFIGSPPMNFLDCSLTEKDGVDLLDFGSFELKLPKSLTAIIKQHATSSELILGVRPEDISLGTKKTPETPTQAEVYITEPLGSDFIADVKVDENLVKVKTAHEVGMHACKIGERVWIGFAMDKIHLFDKKSKKAII